MKSSTSVLRVRVDPDVKAKAVKVLDEIGLSTAEAVRILFHRIVADQRLPLAWSTRDTEPGEREE